jgi:hypothetical protein
MSVPVHDISSLADWLGWEVLKAKTAEFALLRWRDAKTGKWFEREATDLEVLQYDQVRALAMLGGSADLGPLGRKGIASEVRALLVAEVRRTLVVESAAGKAQRHGAVMALNAVLHLLGEPQVPVAVVALADGDALQETTGVVTTLQVVEVQRLVQALRYWQDERGRPEHLVGSRPADRQAGELNGLAIACGIVAALVRGDNPYSPDSVGRVV